MWVNIDPSLHPWGGKQTNKLDEISQNNHTTPAKEGKKIFFFIFHNWTSQWEKLDVPWWIQSTFLDCFFVVAMSCAVGWTLVYLFMFCGIMVILIDMGTRNSESHDLPMYIECIGTCKVLLKQLLCLLPLSYTLAKKLKHTMIDLLSLSLPECEIGVKLTYGHVGCLQTWHVINNRYLGLLQEHKKTHWMWRVHIFFCECGLHEGTALQSDISPCRAHDGNSDTGLSWPSCMSFYKWSE